MTRRRSTLSAALLTTAALSGCGLIPNADTVAEVDGDILTTERLDQLTEQDALGEDSPVLEPNADNARVAITIWIQDRVLVKAAQARGLDVEELDDAATAQDYTAHLESTYQALVEDRLTNPVSDDELSAGFADLVCTYPIASEPGNIDEVADRLADGSTIVEAVGTSGAQVGQLFCLRPETIRSQLTNGGQDPTFESIVDDFRASRQGSVIGPIDAAGGSYVFYRPGFDELSDADVAALSQELIYLGAVNDADIKVASAYGTFDGLQVIALG